MSFTERLDKCHVEEFQSWASRAELHYQTALLKDPLNVMALYRYALFLEEVQYVAVRCCVLQIYSTSWRCAAVCCSVLQCVALCCSVLQCVAVCCSVLQCVADPLYVMALYRYALLLEEVFLYMSLFRI